MKKNAAVTLTFVVENTAVDMVTSVAMVVRDVAELLQAVAATLFAARRIPYVVRIRNIAVLLVIHVVMTQTAAVRQNHNVVESTAVQKIRSVALMAPVVTKMAIFVVAMAWLVQKVQNVVEESVAGSLTNVVVLSVVL